MVRNRQTRNNKRLWGLVSSMGWRQMPCYVPSRNSDSIKKTRHHYLLPSEKQGIITELTVPAEENPAQVNFRGKNKQTNKQNKEKTRSMKIWSRKDKCRIWAEIFPCRGRIKRIHKQHLRYLLQLFGLTNKDPERHWTLLQEQPSELRTLCGLQEKPSNLKVTCKKHQAVLKLGVQIPIPKWR